MKNFDKPLNRRMFMRGSLAAGIGTAAIVMVGCGDDDDDPDATQTPTGTTPTPAASNGGEGKEFQLVSGWYKGREVRYYDFGMNTKLVGAGAVAVAPIYAFIKGMTPDGMPDLVAGQHNIVTVAPGDAAYSDLWQVNLVTVPAGYQPDSVKSKADIDARGFQVTPANMFVNCPIVPKGSTFEGGEPLVQGWKDGSEVFYPDFGANPSAAVPIWVFITGMDASGMPKFVQGQRNVIDLVPGDPGYSAFWLVNLVTVPESYQANSVKSAADIRSMGLPVMPTEMLVNCPVVSA